jgi:hypothetical protein
MMIRSTSGVGVSIGYPPLTVFYYPCIQMVVMKEKCYTRPENFLPPCDIETDGEAIAPRFKKQGLADAWTYENLPPCL